METEGGASSVDEVSLEVCGCSSLVEIEGGLVVSVSCFNGCIWCAASCVWCAMSGWRMNGVMKLLYGYGVRMKRSEGDMWTAFLFLEWEKGCDKGDGRKWGGDPFMKFMWSF